MRCKSGDQNPVSDNDPQAELCQECLMSVRDILLEERQNSDDLES